jgi:hypothetical protein
MKVYCAIAAALFALIAGLIAAWHWWKASENFFELQHAMPSEFEVMRGIVDYFASRNNRKAALWTAVSVVASAISSLVGAWPSN